MDYDDGVDEKLDKEIDSYLATYSGTDKEILGVDENNTLKSRVAVLEERLDEYADILEKVVAIVDKLKDNAKATYILQVAMEDIRNEVYRLRELNKIS